MTFFLLDHLNLYAKTNSGHEQDWCCLHASMNDIKFVYNDRLVTRYTFNIITDR